MEPSESRVGGPRPALINSLPPELLSHIFLSVDIRYRRGIATQSQFCPLRIGSRFPSNSSPSHLGSVCTHWRKVSLATPALWASLYIVILGPPCNQSGVVLKRIKTHIKRSASSPLSIFLDIDRFHSTEHFDLVPEAIVATESFQNLSEDLGIFCDVLRCIFSEADRIAHFSLKISEPTFTFTTSLLLHFQPRFVALSHLTIQFRSQNSTRSILGMFASLSRLRSLYIIDPPLWEVDRTMDFKLVQITSIRIGSASLDRIYTLLSFCPNICWARVKLCDDRNYTSPPDVPKIPLPYLHTLHIEVVDDFATLECTMALFTATVISPRLNELTVVTKSKYHDFMGQHLPHMLSPIFQPLLPNLDAFCFEGFGLDRPRLFSLLERMPNLRRLEVVGHGYDRDLFVGLLEGLSERRLVPRLNTLRLLLPGWMIGDNVVERMLEFRIGTLHSVYLALMGGVEDGLNLKRLRVLQDQGLAVRVVQVTDPFSRKEIREIIGYQRRGDS